MKITRLKNIFFSPRGTTASVSRAIADRFDEPCLTTDLIRSPIMEELDIPADTLTIVSVPVYYGRVPEVAAESLRKLKGNHTAVIAVVVYGNRAYEDALLELSDLLKERGFVVISAGAFVGRHSIFPMVAADRPDVQDELFIQSFAERSKNVLAGLDEASEIHIRIPGKRPYRPGGKVPFAPTAGKDCDDCGICVDICPTRAITLRDTSATDKTKCIACGACIHSCPQQARHYTGFAYRMAARKFRKKYSARKEPEVFYGE